MFSGGRVGGWVYVCLCGCVCVCVCVCVCLYTNIYILGATAHVLHSVLLRRLFDDCCRRWVGLYVLEKMSARSYRSKD